LWPQTRKLLKKLLPKSGPVFTTKKNTPLVYYAEYENGVPCRVDAVTNWWTRTCRKLKIPTG
jgi:hypothetical protein